MEGGILGLPLLHAQTCGGGGSFAYRVISTFPATW